MKFNATQIAELVSGTVDGNPKAEVSRLSKIEEGTKGSLSFLANPKYTPFIYSTAATITLVSDDFVAEKKYKTTLVRVNDPYEAFSKLLNQKAIHKPSAQHVLDDDYYKRIEAIQFTMSHDDGKKTDDLDSADVILLGVSRTSKTPTSIYLANRGYKTINIPLVLDQKIPPGLTTNTESCIIGLIADPERLADIRRNRVAIMRDNKIKEYTEIDYIQKELLDSKKLFKKNNWPVIDVTRRSVEETAASILKIIEIRKHK